MANHIGFVEAFKAYGAKLKNPNWRPDGSNGRDRC
jgi:hypothetical protein